MKREPCEDLVKTVDLEASRSSQSGVHGALVGLGMCGIVRAAVGRVGVSLGVILFMY